MKVRTKPAGERNSIGRHSTASEWRGSKPASRSSAVLLRVVLVLAVLAAKALTLPTVGATPAQQAYVKASNTGASAVFGNRVAVSGDTMVVGAFQEDSNAIG